MYQEADVNLDMIHSGGDEIPYGAWQGSPICERLIQNEAELSGSDDLQAYFLKRLIAIFGKQGVSVGGWEEIVLETDESGHNTTNINYDLVGQPIQPYVWNAVWGWGREDMSYKLANAGYNVIMCNSGSLYFDLAYERHPSEPGLTWSGFVNTRSAFEFEPYDMFAVATMDRNGEPLDEAYVESRVLLEPAAQDNIIWHPGATLG